MSAEAARMVFDFAEGSREQVDLLGGKGANLAEMTRLGLPVPPGFTITTDACRHFLDRGEEPQALRIQVTMALRRLEDQLGRRLGDVQDPLLVSVRSGAKFSMPGMMETVLNVGLNDYSVKGLAEAAQDERFAWDSYRRLLQMFGRTVLDIPAELFEKELSAAKDRAGVSADVELTPQLLQDLVATFKGVIAERTGREFPQDPREQLDMAMRAVFNSWNTDRARIYRRRERIPQDLGTAVNVCAMVFGNLGETSGTGVCFTRDPATGKQGVYGDYLPNAQGEDVVAGIRNTLSLEDFARLDPSSHGELTRIMRRLETHYRDLCDIEFTVERGKLWMLQTRVGKRTAAAAFRIATQLVDERLITQDEALHRVTGHQLSQLMFPQFDPDAERSLLTKGMAASPGAAVGEVVFDSATAVARAAEGRSVLLVRRETTPDDLEGMIAAAGVLTSRGGKTSHAAVVARGMGRTCVCGAEAIDIDADARVARVKDIAINEGDVLSIDGSTGEVFLGELPVVAPPVVTYLEEGLDAALGVADDEVKDLVRAVDRLLRHADRTRRLAVRANADTAEDAGHARRMGAEGIGLTPHRAHVPRRAPHAGRAADPGRRSPPSARRRSPSCCRCSARTSSGCSPRWTGCPPRSGCSTRPCTSSSPTAPSSPCGWRWRRRPASPTRPTNACSPPSSGCTSPTRCSACAVCGWAWSCRACSPCRCARSSRPQRSASATAATRGWRSWCRSWAR